MKRLIPFLFVLLFLPAIIQSQVSISVEPESFTLTGNPTQTDIAYHIAVTNTSTETISLFWSKRMTGNPVNWISWICDKNLCYDYETHSTPANKPNVLNPNESFDLQVHMNPLNTEGTADYELNILDAEGIVIASIDGEILINTSTAVKETAGAKLTVYPNPTQDYFQVTETPGLRYIEVFNIVGNKMKSYDASPQKSYYVGDLAEGIYLVRLTASSGKVLKTIRLSKR